MNFTNHISCYTKSFFISILLVLFLFNNISCSTTDDAMPTTEVVENTNKISFIVKGGDFNTELVELTDFFEPNMRALYESSTSSTFLQATGVWKNEPSSISIHFPSDDVGLFQFRGENNNDFFPTESEDIFITLGTTHLFINGATLEITEYGAAIGDHIKGNFFGTWTDPSGQVITINQGEFEFVRTM